MYYDNFISQKTQFHQLKKPFLLELGGELTGVQIAYRTFGKLNAARDNAIWVCHALTGSADVDLWWAPLLGSGKALDPHRNFIVCSNILGSCYGTTGPTSLNAETGNAYGASFPAITIGDMVHLQNILLEKLGIQSLQMVIGASLGGMQALEWALLYPEKVKTIALIATSSRHSAWCIGLNETQRQAIYLDPHWQGGNYSLDKQPTNGLAIARMIAMSSYRSWESFSMKFGRSHSDSNSHTKDFAIHSYLKHHGKKLVKRFDANTYIALTHAMDRHDIAHHGQNYKSILKSIKQPSLIVGITSDLLYPIQEQQELANFIPHTQLRWLDSIHGHDSFLIDMDVLNDFVIGFGNSLQGLVSLSLASSNNCA